MLHVIDTPPTYAKANKFVGELQQGARFETRAKMAGTASSILDGCCLPMVTNGASSDHNGSKHGLTLAVQDGIITLNRDIVLVTWYSQRNRRTTCMRSQNHPLTYTTPKKSQRKVDQPRDARATGLRNTP